MDITPPNRRPDADKVAARHGEVQKHWRGQRQRRSEETPDKPRGVRMAFLRWPELMRLLRVRYGTVMPDTLEARRDLEILINYALLTGKKPRHIVEIWAPWLPEDELDHIAAQRPVLHKTDDLAHRLDLQYCDRQALAIHTIGSTDVDKAERDRLRLERRNEAKRQKRANQGYAGISADPATKHSPVRLTPRQRTVQEMIGDAETAVPDLVERLAKRKVFRGASMRQRVHEALDQLRDEKGLIADRYAPGQKGPVRHVSRRQQ